MKTKSTIICLFSLLVGCSDSGGSDRVEQVGDYTVEQCDNGVDDNGDGLVDCEDNYCQLQEACIVIPADPSTRAPTGDATELTNFHDSIRFLYEGDDPIIRGVNPGAIMPNRAVVIRGKILDVDGEPLAGVRARIAGQPALGYTYSRADGMIDLVGNAGEPITVRYDTATHLPVDRKVNPNPNSFAQAATIVLTPVDEKITSIDVSRGGQIAAGSQVDDADGQRTLQIYFEPDTLAQVTLPNGEILELDKFDVRATEYTVGARGPERMPALLPDNIAYTYAVELSLETARELGIHQVEFDKPVRLYLDNFLDFPVGMLVPSGVYSRDRYQWEPNPNGQIIQRVGDGIDVDGDGVADSESTLASLGITPDELKTLRNNFSDGKVIWRSPVTHFSPHDLNWPFEFPEDAIPPDWIPDFPEANDPDPCVEAGSILECQNQVLAEKVHIPGSSASLWYRSDRVAGRGRSLKIEVTGADIPESLDKVYLTVVMAGQSHTEVFEPAPDIVYDYEWDGLDAYGREVNGSAGVYVEISYTYPINYLVPTAAGGQAAFGGPGGAPARPGRHRAPIRRKYRGTMSNIDVKKNVGLGGWMLDLQPIYDADDQLFYPASAPEQAGRDVSYMVHDFETFGADAPAKLGFDPRDGDFALPDWMELGPDGSLYVGMRQPSGATLIVRRAPDGTLERVAGRIERAAEHPCVGVVEEGDCKQVGPALDALVTAFYAAVAPDGTLYYASGQCIYRLVEGELSVVNQGWCTAEYSWDDDLPNSIEALAVGPDGVLYAGDYDGIYQVDPKTGEVWLYAGGDNETFGDGGPAIDARVISPRQLTVTSDGAVHFIDDDRSIRSIDPSGIINTVYVGEPGDKVLYLTASPDDALYFAEIEGEGEYIKHLVGGAAITIAGAEYDDLGASDPEAYDRALGAHDIPASSALLTLFGLSVDAAGTVYYLAYGRAHDQEGPVDLYSIIKEVRSAYPTRTASGETLVASSDGSRVYRFAAGGKVLEVISARTGATLYDYTYDSTGYLSTIDVLGQRQIQIERSADGSPRAIIGPFGHRTEFELDENGYISVIRAPDGAQSQYIYSDSGLLQEVVDPNGAHSRYEYSMMGRLMRAEDPAGGWKKFIRTRKGVRVETAEGRVVDYDIDVERGDDGRDYITVMTDAAGLKWRTTRSMIKGKSLERPDGSILTTRNGHDRRFGLQVPFVEHRTTELPSGLTQTMNRTREVTMGEVGDLFSLETLTERTDIGGRVWTTVYDAAGRTSTRTSPEGRVTVASFDEFDRLTGMEVPGYRPIRIERDAAGRVSAVYHGERSVTASFGSDGLIESLSNALGTGQTLRRDASGRVISVQDGGGLEQTFGFDPKGNMTSLASDGAEYAQTFTPYGALSSRESPAGDTRHWTHDLDRRLAGMSLPTGEDVGYEYDTAGRLVRAVTPQGDYVWTYDAETGQLTELRSPDVTTELTRDSFLITKTAHSFAGAAASVQRKFDSDFWVTERTISGSAPVTREFDADGLLTRAGPLSLTHDTASTALFATRVDQVESQRTYDDYGGLDAESFVAENQSLYDYSLHYDEVGQVVGKTETINGVTHEWTYVRDDSGWLVEVQKDGVAVESYAYDSRGNIIEINGESATYRIDDTVESVGARNYTFDSAGHLASWMESGQTTSFDIDTRGQLRQVTAGGQTVGYLYDGLGRRVARTVNGAMERGWVFDDSSHPVARLNAGGDTVARYVYASRAYVPDLIIKDSRTYRVITDHLGSVRLVVDAADGSVKQRLEYDAYGNITLDTNPGFQPFGFVGGIHDPMTGLIHFGHRDYDPHAGRWTTPDPLGFGGGTVNLYLYGANDPVQFVDPEGEAVVLFVIVASAAIGGGWLFKGSVKNTAYRSANEAGKLLEGYGANMGPTDALRHCTMNCNLKREYGSMVAKVASWYHEVPEQWLKGKFKSAPDRGMDEHNNVCGRAIADTQDPYTSCASHCTHALIRGQLETMPEDMWEPSPGSNVARGRSIWESWRKL